MAVEFDIIFLLFWQLIAQAEIQGGQTSTCTVSGDVLNGTYVFAQMHFHWGSTDDKGSEHTVNGQRYKILFGT